MPHTSNFTGDLPGIGSILGDIDAFSGRRRADTKEQTLAQRVQGILDPKDQTVQQRPKATSIAGGAMDILGQLAPQLAQAVGNPQQAPQVRQEAESGLALAGELQKMPSHAERVSRLRTEAGQLSAKGEDISRVVELANMDPDQLGLELSRMELIGNAVIDSTPTPAANLAAIIASNPALGTSLLNRRDKQIAAEQARRARAAAKIEADKAPQTQFGKDRAKIVRGIAGGHIPEEIGNQMIANLDAAAVATAAPAFSGKVPDGFMFADPGNPRSGVVPIPGAVAGGGKPNIQEIFDTETGLKKKVIVNNDGSFSDLGGTQAPAAGPQTFRQATPEEAAAFGQPFGQINEATGKFIPVQTPPGLSININEDGSFSLEQGPGVGGASIVDPTGASRRAPKDFELFQDPDSGELRQRVIRGSETANEIIAESNVSHRAIENYAASTANVERKIDRAIEIIETADVPVTGLIGFLSKAVPGTPAFELNSLVGQEGTIATNEAFDLLRQMKSESKTGGAVGQLSDPERRAMSTIHSNLQQSNNKEALLTNLRELRDFRAASFDRVKDAFAEDFKDIAAQFGAPSGILSVDEIVGGADISQISTGDINFMSKEAIAAYIERVEAEGL